MGREDQIVANTHVSQIWVSISFVHMSGYSVKKQQSKNLIDNKDLHWLKCYRIIHYSIITLKICSKYIIYIFHSLGIDSFK